VYEASENSGSSHGNKVRNNTSMAAGHARKYKTHRPTNPAAAMVPNRTVNNSETDDKTVISAIPSF
jgi:hypothetical protein